jgi:Trp operon repressor
MQVSYAVWVQLLQHRLLLSLLLVLGRMEDVQQVTFAHKELLTQHLAQQEVTTQIQGNPHAQHVQKGNIAQGLH